MSKYRIIEDRHRRFIVQRRFGFVFWTGLTGKANLPIRTAEGLTFPACGFKSFDEASDYVWSLVRQKPERRRDVVWWVQP